MDNYSDYNGKELVAVSIIFLCLTYVSILLRCYVRIRITKAFSIDDWFLVIAQGIFTLSCSFILRGVHHGLGHHNKSLTVASEIEGLKWQGLATITYIANMMFIKLSLAIFLMRLAVQQRYIWILRVSVVIIAIWSTAIFIYTVFQCTPVQAQWDYTIIDKHCVSSDSFVSAAYSISVMTILSDWLYALLPIPMIWSVQMSIQKKVTVAFILGLGVFASIATLIRLKYILGFSDTSDILFTGTPAMVWTLVEPGIATIAASLVTIRPLLRAFRIHGFESNESSPLPRNNGDTPLILRADRNWNATSVSSKGDGLDRSVSLGAIQKLKMAKGNGSGIGLFEEGDERGRGGQKGIGIRRTVDVRIHSGRASSRSGDSISDGT